MTEWQFDTLIEEIRNLTKSIDRAYNLLSKPIKEKENDSDKGTDKRPGRKVRTADNTPGTKKFDTAIIGVSRDAYEDLHVVYDYNKVIDVIAGKDMTEEEAKEFFEYNTQRSLGSMGDNYPIINYTDVEDIP